VDHVRLSHVKSSQGRGRVESSQVTWARSMAHVEAEERAPNVALVAASRSKEPACMATYGRASTIRRGARDNEHRTSDRVITIVVVASEEHQKRGPGMVSIEHQKRGPGMVSIEH
jgi:hypothetical protein